MKNVLICLSMFAAIAACTKQQDVPQLSADLDAGKTFAGESCAGCHGVDGDGVAPGIPDLANQVESYLADSLLAYREGRRNHAALKDLASNMSDAEIRDVAGYYASLPAATPADSPQPVDKQSSFQAGELAAEGCIECHGEAGNSTVAGIPSLAGQQPLYFIAATQAYLQGGRQKPDMGSILQNVSRLDLERLAIYFASQTPIKGSPPELGNSQRGEPLTAQCGGCHGAQGISTDTATPNLAGQDAQYLVSALKAYRGHTRQHDVMLAEKSDTDILHIAAYYATREPKAAESDPVSAQKLAEKCDRCHGPGVNNPAMAIPRINGQDRAYLIMALRAYRDDRRESSTMHKMSLPYGDSLIEDVASLYAGRPFE